MVTFWYLKPNHMVTLSLRLQILVTLTIMSFYAATLHYISMKMKFSYGVKKSTKHLEKIPANVLYSFKVIEDKFRTCVSAILSNALKSGC